MALNRMGRLLQAVLLISLLCLSTKGVAAAPARLSGGFIQYQDWMMKLTPNQWRRELSAMRKIGAKVIILQGLAANQQSFISQPDSNDPTTIILKYADQHHIKVFLGLLSVDSWWNHTMDAAYLSRLAQRESDFAGKVWHRYRSYRAFAGWYIPTELWDGSWNSEQVAALNRFLLRISAECHRLSDKLPVAISPFYSGTLTPPQFQALYQKMLHRAGIQIVMLQDGVGARNLGEAILQRVVPYFQAMEKACKSDHVKLWANAESFHIEHGTPVNTGSTQFVPASISRLIQQLQMEAPYVQRIITFDLFHYMSPYRGPAQARLYEEYRKWMKDPQIKK